MYYKKIIVSFLLLSVINEVCAIDTIIQPTINNNVNNLVFLVYKTDISISLFEENNIQIDNGIILKNIYNDKSNFKFVAKEKILLTTGTDYDSFITNNRLNKSYFAGVSTNQSLVYNIGMYLNNELRVNLHHSNYDLLNKVESSNSFDLIGSYQIDENQCLNIYNPNKYNEFNYIYLICLMRPEIDTQKDSQDLN